MLLAGSAVVGMVLMNSPWSDRATQLLALPLQVGVGDWMLSKPIELWINDFLMAIFFLLVGVEIKHEWGHGALATPQARVLPLGAAVGGMAVPALLFVLFNLGQPANLAGWAIPAATDIAFAIGLMALAAPHIRGVLLAFLTAVAVIDDLGAIIVIALFYTDQLSKAMLGFAAVGVGALFVLSSLRVNRICPMWRWGCSSGSVCSSRVSTQRWRAWWWGSFCGLAGRQQPGREAGSRAQTLGQLADPAAVRRGQRRGVAGRRVVGDAVAARDLGVAAGLLLGKPVGILAGTWAASRIGGGLPDGMRLRDYVPVACFCGIGFTMALFIATLAFPPGSDAADAAKMGVLLGTVGAFVLGTAVARLVPQGRSPARLGRCPRSGCQPARDQSCRQTAASCSAGRRGWPAGPAPPGAGRRAAGSVSRRQRP